MSTDGHTPPASVATPHPIERPWRSPVLLGSIVASFIRRDWKIARSYRLGFALELLSTVVSLILFFYVGRLIDTSSLQDISDLPTGYFSFVVIGLAVMRVGQSTFGSFSGKLRREQTTGTLEALLATPPPPWVVILASAAYEVVYATISAASMLVVAAVMGLDLRVSAASAAALVIALPAITVLFAAAGILIAAATLVFKQIQTIQSFGVSAVALLGGVYFPVGVLPDAVQPFSHLIPVTWGIDAMRAALLDGEVAVVKIVGVAAAGVVLLPASLAVFRVAVDHVRRRGGLTQY